MEQPSKLRTYVLTERSATTCRLGRQDVDFLLGAHRAHVELVPTERRGYYRLTPKGHVGTVVCPTCRLLIRPKIPIENLFYLLDPTGPVPSLSDQVTPLPGTEFLDFLAGRLAQLLKERAAAGLHRAYQERADQGPFLRGQVDLPAHVRDRNSRKDQLHCRFEEFTPDVLCNQIPKATAELAVRSPLLGDGVRVTLRRTLEAFTAVTSITVDRDSFPAAITDRLTEAYRPLLNLCRVLVESLGLGEHAGSTACPAFLLDMEEVFERYVTAGVVRAFAGHSRVLVSVQPLFTANKSDASLPDIHLRPDFTIAAGDRPFLVGDAKWKNLAGSPLVTADLYQVITYCTALGVNRGVLVYPGRRDRVWNYSLARAPLSVEIRMLRVTAKRESCARSLRRLARSLRSGGGIRRVS
jgi:5-methylcytosine-specific restriction enzyme subunit McrC